VIIFLTYTVKGIVFGDTTKKVQENTNDSL
jgi:p-aminobenzoyl-glutamate transporter AbgT